MMEVKERREIRERTLDLMICRIEYDRYYFF